MSVINQMLKDLEKRSIKRSTEMNRELTYYPALNDKKSFKKGFLFITLFFIVMFFMIDLYLMRDHFSTIKKPTQAFHLSQLSQTTFLNAAPLSNSAFLKGFVTEINLKNSIKSTTFEIFLSNLLLYRVGRNPVTGALIVTFENASFSKKLPQLNYINTAIKRLQILNQPNHQIVFLIYLNPGVQLQNIGYDSIHPMHFQIKLSLPKTTESVQPISVQQSILSKNSDAIYQQAITLWKNQKQADAESLLTKSLNNYPNKFEFVLLQARIEFDEGKTKKAIALLEQYSPNLAEYPEYYAFLSALYQRNDQASLAVKLYQQLLELNPEKSIWWLGLATSLELLGKHNEAIVAYQQAYQTNGLTPVLKAFVETKIYPD